MDFLRRLMGLKKDETPVYKIDSPVGELRLWVEDTLEKDPDARMEEFWIESMDVSEDAYWLLVGRRHGMFQLYDWTGKLHRLPSRPPAQVVSKVLFRGRYLALLTPPYLVVYFMEDPKNPPAWKSFRFSQEGFRPSFGLDIRNNLLAFGTVGSRVYVIDLGSDINFQTVDFRYSISYSGIGDLREIRFIDNNRIYLSGTEGGAIYHLNGSQEKVFPYRSGGAVALQNQRLYLAEGNTVVVLDTVSGSVLQTGYVDMKVSQMDLDPEGNFLFLADAEQNRMGILDAKTLSTLTVLEGFGYSVVRVSPDGSVYTCRKEETEERTFYYLTKLSSNILDFVYPQERQRQVIKNAEDLYREFQKKLKRAKRQEEIETIEEFKQLLSIDIPLGKVRQMITKAQEEMREKLLQIFLQEMREKLQNGTVDKEDVKLLEERIKTAEREEDIRRLEQLKEEVLTYMRTSMEQRLEELRKLLAQIEVRDITEMEALEEVKSFREFMTKLVSDLQHKAQEELTRLLQERLVEYRLKRFRIQITPDKVMLGKEEFPKFSGERRRLHWRLVVEDRLVWEGKTLVKIAFQREDGVVVEPKRYPAILSQEELRHPPRWLSNYLRHLRGLCSHQEYRRPVVVAYEETPWFVENLERFTSLVKDQLAFGEGILILEGDAGTGKNFLVEVFSALTGRPLYIIPCNSKLEKEDLTFTYEFDARRGTRRVYSELVKALQTPGAVIYLDEINTLPPSLVKLFNPLFDYRRYLALPTGEVIKARRDVILVGGMNPQHYLGVSELPQDIKSRADVLYIDYPPFEDGRGFYYPDEAIILKDYVPHLSELNTEEFSYLWYLVVNGVATERAKAVWSKEREKEYFFYGSFSR